MCNEQKYTDKSAGGVTTDEARAMAMEHYNRGKELWRQGRRGEAMSEYNRAVLHDPDSPAATALEMANCIMDFYDHDRYNP